MFRPKKHIKLDVLTIVPKLHDLQRALRQAQKNRGSTVELPWRLKETDFYYSLAVRAEFGPTDPVWTLYEGDGSKSRIVWSAPFTDLELLKEVIFLTVAESTGMSDSPQHQLTATVYETVGEILPAEQNTAADTVVQPETEAIAESAAARVSIPPAMPLTFQNQSMLDLPAPDPELFNKQKRVMLGEFFIETALITPEILNLALKLQALVAAGSIDRYQSIEALKKANKQNGKIDLGDLLKDNITATDSGVDTESKPLLGEVLVRAGLINNSVLLAILKLQEVVQSGAMTMRAACHAFKQELDSRKSQNSSVSATLETDLDL